MKEEGRRTLACLTVLFCAASLLAAPAVKKDPVAEGFMDWNGLTQKNWLFGRQLTPSDLRHRVVVYVAIDGKKLSRDALINLNGLIDYGAVPAGHTTQWESQEMPRNRILVISVFDAPKNLTSDTFKEYLNAKNLDTDDARALETYKTSLIPVYKDLTPDGAEAVPEEKMPYVAVYGGVGTEDHPAAKPLGTWNNYSFRNKDRFLNSKKPDSIASVCRKAQKDLAANLDWKRPLGVREPKFYAKVVADFEKGKPAQGLLNVLRGGIKDKNPEKAKEAQIMFDAILQYKEELKLRIACEIHTAPARAYCDYMTLTKLFPAEKKSLQSFEAKFKGAKEIAQLGKVLEKLLLWDREDFFCKSDGEARKIVAELQKMKKQIAPLSESKNAQVQGEAMLFTSQIEGLVETIPSKVVQK